MPIQSKFLARRGLTFIELMFATVILGVGLIMIAGVFPVAINEQRAMVDESTVSNVERGAVRSLHAAMTHRGAALGVPLLPLTLSGTKLQVQDFDSAPLLKDRIPGEMINKADGRYAWTALFARSTVTNPGPGTDDITLFVVSLVSRNAASFEDTNPTEQAEKLKALKPHKVKITYRYKGESYAGLAGDPEEDTIEIKDSGSNTALAAGEGAYVIRGDIDTTISTAVFPQNMIIKLGTEFTGEELSANLKPGEFDKNKRYFRVQGGFTLLKSDPASDSATGQVTNKDAWVVGRDVSDPANPTANQAIACRAVTVKLKTPGD